MISSPVCTEVSTPCFLHGCHFTCPIRIHSLTGVCFLNVSTQASDAIVQYLEPHTKRPLLTAIEEQLLKPHVMALLEKGFDSLMDTNRCV